ncbi:hypothetical protein C8Q70DRAFT_698374 [Cubamyces menziesii]|nr:hypothetical protein C8Q70DRAFT_698374 [Cubamyces menziesii]
MRRGARARGERYNYRGGPSVWDTCPIWGDRSHLWPRSNKYARPAPPPAALRRDRLETIRRFPTLAPRLQALASGGLFRVQTSCACTVTACAGGASRAAWPEERRASRRAGERGSTKTEWALGIRDAYIESRVPTQRWKRHSPGAPVAQGDERSCGGSKEGLARCQSAIDKNDQAVRTFRTEPIRMSSAAAHAELDPRPRGAWIAGESRACSPLRACERACVRGHKPHDEIGTSVWTFCPRGGGLRNTAENARLGIGRAGLPPRTVPSVGLTSRARFAHTVCTLRDGRRETRHARKFARRGAGCTDAARGLENGRTGKRGMSRSSLGSALCAAAAAPRLRSAFIEGPNRRAGFAGAAAQGRSIK